MGTGEPVLLLHSALSSKLQWYRLMNSLSKQYLVIAPDFSGYGESPFPIDPESFTIESEVRFIESLVSEIIKPAQSFHLVGHSFGGVVALRMAFQNPQRINSLTMYEPVAFHLLDEASEAGKNVLTMHDFINQKVSEGNYLEAVECFVDHWSGKGIFSSFPREFREVMVKGMRKLHIENNMLKHETLLLEDYRKITLPVCIIAGKKSPVEARQVSEILSSNLSNCAMNWLDLGHMAPLNQPEAVNPIIESFIKRFSLC